MSTNTGQNANANWYPTQDGNERYWDGTAWTEHTRPASASAVTAPGGSQMTSTSLFSAPTPNTQGASTAPLAVVRPGGPKKAWWKRGWVLAVVALVVGIGIGSASAGGSDPKSSQAYKDLSAQLAQTKSQAQQQAADDQAKLEQAQGELPTREAALKKSQSQLKAEQSQLKSDQTTVAAREKSVAAREKRVGIVEKTIAANTISGDGMYKVGVDMKAGTYKSGGSSGCYYAVLNSSNTLDIATNNITSGPAFVTVYAGKYFDTQDCADWVLQQ